MTERFDQMQGKLDYALGQSGVPKPERDRILAARAQTQVNATYSPAEQHMQRTKIRVMLLFFLAFLFVFGCIWKWGLPVRCLQ